MKSRSLFSIVLVVLALVPELLFAEPIPDRFTSAGDDRVAILQLLDNYSTAVTTRNQALFESLLLNKSISFSSAGAAVRSGLSDGARNYGEFEKGVFEGPAFTQRFQDIHIDQDGPLASVSLVFVNSSADGSSWGWKTLQLLKVAGSWKIASEFFTGHPLS